MFSSNCCFLTCIQISQEAGKVVWYSHHLKNFPQFVVIHTVRGFGTVNKGEVDVFLELSCFLNDPADAGNLTSGSSAFSKSSLSIWKVTVHVLLKPGLENFEHYFANVWGECNGAVVWTFFGIAFLWDWNENWHFPVPWPLLSFPNLLACWMQHFHSIIFQFSSVQSLSCVQLFVTPWAAARQASLSITNSTQTHVCWSPAPAGPEIPKGWMALVRKKTDTHRRLHGRKSFFIFRTAQFL